MFARVNQNGNVLNNRFARMDSDCEFKLGSPFNKKHSIKSDSLIFHCTSRVGQRCCYSRLWLLGRGRSLSDFSSTSDGVHQCLDVNGAHVADMLYIAQITLVTLTRHIVLLIN